MSHSINDYKKFSEKVIPEEKYKLRFINLDSEYTAIEQMAMTDPEHPLSHANALQLAENSIQAWRVLRERVPPNNTIYSYFDIYAQSARIRPYWKSKVKEIIEQRETPNFARATGAPLPEHKRWIKFHFFIEEHPQLSKPFLQHEKSRKT